MSLTLTPELKTHISTHALENPNIECVGYIVRTPEGELKAIRSVNHATNPSIAKLESQRSRDTIVPHNDALIDAKDYADASKLGEVVGLYHSHVKAGSDTFSKLDVMVARQEKLWMVLYYLPTNRFIEYNPNVRPPLTNREFHVHWQNCYDLVRDAVYEILGHEMDYFYMENPSRIIWEDVGYVKDLPSQGFERIDTWQFEPGDLILTYNGCKHPNHCIVATSATMGLHHNRGERSGEIRIDGLPDRHSHWRIRDCYKVQPRSIPCE